MVAGSVLTSPTSALVVEEVEVTVEEEEDTEEEDVSDQFTKSAKLFADFVYLIILQTEDNPVTVEEVTNKVASVDNSPLTVDKVDTEEVMLPTELELNPEVVRLFISLSTPSS